MKFEKETENIYRLRIPFEELYTSVFLIESEGGRALVDCATTDSDVDDVIRPALMARGLDFSDIKYLILTHRHGDHAGGKERISEHNPSIAVIRGMQELPLSDFELYALPGHTSDMIGVLDLGSGSLISGDGLQGAGVGKYRCSLESETEYLATIERIRRDTRVKNLLFSHAYEPWYKDGALGRDAVMQCLADCERYIKTKNGESK
jgi:glyoxylase-like metal-dependent hydrolase (beta-lactamase superfamily II)